MACPIEYRPIWCLKISSQFSCVPLRLGPEIRGTKLNRVRKVMKRKLVTGLLCCYHMVSVELWMDKTSHNFLNWYRLTQYISINITMAPPPPGSLLLSTAIITVKMERFTDFSSVYMSWTVVRGRRQSHQMLVKMNVDSSALLSDDGNYEFIFQSCNSA